MGALGVWSVACEAPPGTFSALMPIMGCFCAAMPASEDSLEDEWKKIKAQGLLKSRQLSDGEKKALEAMPPTWLFHGAKDTVISVGIDESTVKF